jgi:hypothetical protein
VTAKTSDFSFFELFNMDVGKAVKTCRMPDCGLFCSLMGMAVVPIFAGLSLYVGTWYFATRVGKDPISQALEEAEELLEAGDLDAADHALDRVASKRVLVAKEHTHRRGLPLRWHHLQRGVIQLFLFTFAPVTRKCAEMLICRRVINDGIEDLRLVSDLSLQCWTGVHLVAAVISAVVLFFYAVYIPSQLLKRTQMYMGKRLLERDEEEVKKVPDPSWCTLCDPHSWLSTARGDESVNPTLLMRMKAVPTLNPKCWDELFKATRPEKYYWFIFILLLKMMVNLIFLLGQAIEYNWGMWLQICLVFAALLSHYQVSAPLKQARLHLSLCACKREVCTESAFAFYLVCVYA